MAEAIYVGNGKKHYKFDGCITFSHSREQVELMLASINKKGYVNTVISPTKNDPTRFYEKIDTYVVTKKDKHSEEKEEARRQGFQPNDDLNKLPF